jgi:photosystem II stability/assembly factor-like uncharacterized protein
VACSSNRDERTRFWQQTNGPYGGNIRAFAVNSSGVVFAGTVGAGVFRSSDNGGYWATLNDSLANTGIIDIDINSDGYIFALTEARILVRSIDAGKTWTKVKIDDSVPEKWVTSLAINADGNIFASTFYLSGDIFQSKDNGNTWTRIYQGYVRLSIEALTVNSSGHVFAASLTTRIFRSAPPPRTFVYRSTDNGLTWETFGNGLTAGRLCGFIGTTAAISSLETIKVYFARPTTVRRGRQATMA